jgi:hypothetical protein
MLGAAWMHSIAGVQLCTPVRLCCKLSFCGMQTGLRPASLLWTAWMQALQQQQWTPSRCQQVQNMLCLLYLSAGAHTCHAPQVLASHACDVQRSGCRCLDPPGTYCCSCGSDDKGQSVSAGDVATCMESLAACLCTPGRCAAAHALSTACVHCTAWLQMLCLHCHGTRAQCAADADELRS